MHETWLGSRNAPKPMNRPAERIIHPVVMRTLAWQGVVRLCRNPRKMESDPTRILNNPGLLE